MKNYKYIFFISFCAVFIGVGCATMGPGTFNANGFIHTDYDYMVRSISGGHSAVLPRTWILENYHGEDNDPKTGVNYQVKYYIDVDRDGGSDFLGKQFKYDLLFTHRHNGGIIWLTTEPLHLDMKEKDLAVLLHSEIEDLAGIHYGSIELRGMRFRTSTEKEIATKVLDMTPGTVAGMDAVAATVDVVSVSQWRFDPNTPRDRMRLVFIRTPFQCKTRKRNVTLPVLMIAGYANSDSDFDKGIADFNDFISRILVGGKTGAEFQPIEKPIEAAPLTETTEPQNASSVLEPAFEEPTPPPATENDQEEAGPSSE